MRWNHNDSTFAIKLLQHMENDARNNNMNEKEKIDEKIWEDEDEGTNKFGQLHIFL